jgi:hypothetical protein
VPDDPRQAPAAFAWHDGRGVATQRGEGVAVIGDDALSVGPVTVVFLDADGLRAGDYRLELDCWPEGRLVLTQLGRRFDGFARALAGARNRARVAGLLAHGITLPEVFPGAVLDSGTPRAAELQVYDTHITVVPESGDPWQVPLGALSAVRGADDPPGVVLESATGRTVLGQLARRRDELLRSVARRLEEQARRLVEVSGQAVFADGVGVARDRIAGFDTLVERFAAPARLACARALLARATGEPRFGFVQLLDPDGEALQSPSALPEHWASFLLVPVGDRTTLEILAGPSAATYVFRSELEAVNRDLQALHFRRAQLALTGPQAEVTATNPHRLALRRLEPLRRLRACTTARLIHDGGWDEALREALA